MKVTASSSRGWLAETPQLDLSHPAIRLTALNLTPSVPGDRERALAIHDFVRRVPFGAFSDVSHVRASDVLRANRGDCHSKGVLFVALCRAARLPARLNFLRIAPRYLNGILEEIPQSMAHALGQVLIDGEWISDDGYVVDPVLFARAWELMRLGLGDSGWGIVAEARETWDGRSDCLQQFAPGDVLHDYGPFDDAAAFYEDLSRDQRAPSWVTRLAYALTAQLVNRRAEKLREMRELREDSVLPLTGDRESS
jgi:hypothetical protein